MTERQVPDMLSPEEAARLLGISTRTLARYAREHRIRAVMLPSGHRRYRTADIQALLNPRASA